MEAPQGFKKDPASGLYYSDIYVTDMATGKKVRRVVWFDSKTGTFNQVDYPAEDIPPQTGNSSPAYGYHPQPGGQMGPGAYSNMRPPVRKKGHAGVVIVLCLFFLLAIGGLCVWGAVSALEKYGSGQTQSAGDAVSSKGGHLIIDWEKVQSTATLVEAADERRLRIQVEGLNLLKLDESAKMNRMYLYIGDYALEICYYSDKTKWLCGLYKVTGDDPDEWERQSVSVNISVESNLFVVETNIDVIENFDFGTMTVIPVQLVFNEYDVNKEVFEGDLRVEPVKIPDDTGAKEEPASPAPSTPSPPPAENSGENNNGNNNAQPSNAFPFAGTFTCMDEQIPNEYRPSITFNSDMSFSMVINTGEGMAYTSGVLTWDSTNNSVYFQFSGSVGEPAEAYGYFYDANTFVFMGEGFGLLGYGDNYGVMSR